MSLRLSWDNGPGLGLALPPLGLFLVFCAVVLASGCDPCMGLTDCQIDPKIAAEGALIVRKTGEGVPDVSVDFVRIGGVPVDEDSVRATTDGNGRFKVSFEALEDGEATFVARVHPTDRDAYVVQDIVLSTSRIHGDAKDLGRWVVDPYLAFLGELWDRHTRKPVRAAGRVVFRRTGGLDIEPSESIAGIAQGGRFFFSPETNGIGTVFGELTVNHPDYPAPRVIRDFPISTRHNDQVIELDRVLMLGLALEYSGEIFRRSASEGHDLTQYRVRFRRTGGIRAEIEDVEVPVQPWGGFFLDLRPRSAGVMTGELEFHLPPPMPSETVAIELATFQDDGSRFLGRLGVGPSLAYAMEVYQRRAGKQLPVPGGTLVEFRRTGGVAVEDEVLTSTTTAWGGVFFRTLPLGEGRVVGDLIVHAPEPTGVLIRPGFELETHREDGDRSLGRVGLGHQIDYGATLFDKDTGVGIGGVEIEFIRTGGIAASPERVVQTTKDWGGFFLQLETDEIGDVVGEFHIRFPAPRGTVVITGVRVPTFDEDAQQFLGFFGV